MRILLLFILGASLSVATVAWSQNRGSSQSGNQAGQGNQHQGSQSQANTDSNQNMSGTVSHDGNSVTSDKNDKRYQVDNPETLKGKEDQHVALIVHLDPDNNVIHIIQVEAPPQ
jgi:hypothetical protein